MKSASDRKNTLCRIFLAVRIVQRTQLVGLMVAACFETDSVKCQITD